MPRAGLSTPAVVDAALALADEEGAHAVTLAALAGRTGVAAASLYKHVQGLGHLRQLMGLRVLEELTDRVATAAIGRGRDEAVAAVLTEWRAYAAANPRRYALLPPDPLSDPVQAEAGRRLLDVIAAMLAGYGLRGAAAVHEIRCIRAAVHGFVSLETAGGFGLPQDLDTSFQRLIRMVVASLETA